LSTAFFKTFFRARVFWFLRLFFFWIFLFLFCTEFSCLALSCGLVFLPVFLSKKNIHYPQISDNAFFFDFPKKMSEFYGGKYLGFEVGFFTAAFVLFFVVLLFALNHVFCFIPGNYLVGIFLIFTPTLSWKDARTGLNPKKSNSLLILWKNLYKNLLGIKIKTQKSLDF